METFQKRLCGYCGDVLRGRSDKLFCDDRCRNQHHNKRRQRPTLSEYARGVKRMLVHNHRVLQYLLGERASRVVDIDVLLRGGVCLNSIRINGWVGVDNRIIA